MGLWSGCALWGSSYTTIVVLLILVWRFACSHCCVLVGFLEQLFSFRRHNRFESHPSVRVSPSKPPAHLSQLRISNIISRLDLKYLMDNLDKKLGEGEKWENVIDRSSSSLSYSAKCCKSMDSSLKYLSTAVFECCSAEMLREFYMDNFYRKKWDKTVIDHKQLEVDEDSGTEIGRTIKKFPLLTPREYVLAWRMWEGRDKTYYCYIKECEHPFAPRQKKYVRVRFFRSGWRIKKVPGRNACEIKMIHEEDAGLNANMARLIFSKGIWSYMCKMETALLKYSSAKYPPLTEAVGAVTLVQKVPLALDAEHEIRCTSLPPETPARSATCCQASWNCRSERRKKLFGRPSKRLIANGLILVGGVICLTRGHHNLGAKTAFAYMLSKLTKRDASFTQSSQTSV